MKKRNEKNHRNRVISNELSPNLKSYWKDEKEPVWFGTIFPYILRECVEGRILDVGCGNGAIANELIRHGKDVWGIDLDSVGISIANEVCKKNGIDEKRFFVCDITKSELPSSLKNIKFDIVICTEVVEHMYSPDKLVKFCHDCVNGGKLIISTPYHGYIKNLVLSVLNRWDRHFFALIEGAHIKFWSKKTLSILLERNGWSVKRYYGTGRIPFLWKSMIMICEYNEIAW